MGMKPENYVHVTERSSVSSQKAMTGNPAAEEVLCEQTDQEYLLPELCKVLHLLVEFHFVLASFCAPGSTY